MQHQVGRISRSFCRHRKPHSACVDSQFGSIGCRFLQIQATPSSTNPTIENADSPSGNTLSPLDSSSPDARFEVLGSSSSLLSISLSASQTLFTRRGSLVGVSGTPENATSTLSTLSPLRRAPLGVPFLYQKIASTTPVSLLVGTRTPNTSFTVLNMDGRMDWMVTQRTGLLAWTGQSLSVKPSIDTKMSLAHWGRSKLAGRGLVALVGAGNVFQVTLKTGEKYVAHPSNVLAYSINPNPPQPYRFKSSTFRMQPPSIDTFLPKTAFMRNMRETTTFKVVARFFFALRTLTRRTLWGDRLFLHFHGPTTLLVQSRGSRIRDVLSKRDVGEYADSPAGAVQPVASLSWKQQEDQSVLPASSGLGAKTEAQKRSASSSMSYATVGRDGKVRFSKS